MASFLSEEDVMCSLCHDIFKNPVVLSCSHSVCMDCLKNYWSTNKSQECPLCRRRSSRDNPPVSIILKDLCEAYTKEKNLSGELCPSHKERFKLFCKDDKELLCVVCRDSRKHKTHDCSPIDEAAADLKGKLRDLKIREQACCSRVEYIKHLGNLNFRVWLKMRDISHYSPVILDPNTAGRLLDISNDLTTVKHSYGSQNLLDKRFDSSLALRASTLGRTVQLGRPGWEA
ncbi:hypothetical protein AALO_G00173440 [Alosa alosa]|uniref:Uncharacterized protein n=1 Tax=Alosa alosa TaxID=278164 RepID=A0AAV6G721_9TELE|nr:hypothetical protein AALO_G00173440 [Alosa alosa]